VNIKEIYEIAMANVVAPDDDYLYRKICRQYSTLFHTPLHIVFTLPPDEVLKFVYEYQLEQLEEEDLDVAADRIVNPDDYKNDEEDFDQYVKDIENQEKAKHQKKEAERAKVRDNAHMSTESQSLGSKSGDSPVIRKYDSDGEGNN
jgi:hypothetical protein